VLARRATFAKGRHYLEIAASPEKDHRAALRAFVTALEPRVPGPAAVPEAVGWFPTEGLQAESVRLVPESVLGLRILRSGFMGQYPVGRAFVVPEPTAAAATDTMAKLRARFSGASPVAGLGEEAFAAQDQYLGKLLAFRKGARIAGVVNVAPDGNATPLAEAFAGRLP
jgi:hypothetical protein